MSHPLSFPTALAAALASVASLASPGSARAAGLPTLQEVAVTAASHDLAGVADSATEGTVTGKQLANRPLLRPAEVLVEGDTFRVIRRRQGYEALLAGAE